MPLGNVDQLRALSTALLFRASGVFSTEKFAESSTLSVEVAQVWLEENPDFVLQEGVEWRVRAGVRERLRSEIMRLRPVVAYETAKDFDPNSLPRRSLHTAEAYCDDIRGSSDSAEVAEWREQAQHWLDMAKTVEATYVISRGAKIPTDVKTRIEAVEKFLGLQEG